MQVMRYLAAVLRFASSASRWVYPGLVLAVLGTLLEFVALSVLVPLTQNINHSHMSSIAGYWNELLTKTGISPDTKVWFELFLILIFVRVAAQFAYQVLTSSVSRDVTASLAARAFGTFVKDTSLLEIQRHKIGHFIAIAGDEASRAGQIFLYFSQFLVSVLSVFVTIAAMVVFSPTLALGVAIFVSITGLTIVRSTRRVFRLGSAIKSESRVATSTFLDGLNGLRSVRSIGGEKYVVEQYTNQINKYNRTLFSVDFTTQAQKNLPLIILLLLLLSTIAVLSNDRIAQLNLASTLAALILLMRFFPSAGACLNSGMKLLSDLRAAHDVVSVATSQSAGSTQVREPLEESIREIELVNVTYSYEGTARPVLRDLSYKFTAGHSYAISGPSGSGKSTLMDLMLGLIPNESLNLRVNGKELTASNRSDYRKRVVLVEQQSRIFNDTVRNNIVFGYLASEEEIRWAIRLARFDLVLDTMPNGLETMIDYQGTNLSGGQRQRLGLARALLRKPDVLVLDESTSALDTKTRNEVLGNILREFGEKIVIVVTHDSEVVAQLESAIFLKSNASTLEEHLEQEPMKPTRDDLSDSDYASADSAAP